MNNKVLSKLLSYTDSKLPDTHFNPTLDAETAENVAKSLCKILVITSNNDNNRSALKTNLRKTAVEIIQTLCLVEHQTCDISRKENETRARMITNHLINNNNTSKPRNTKWKKRRKEYEKLDSYDSFLFNINSQSIVEPKDINQFVVMGTALFNLNYNPELTNLIKKYLKEPNYDEFTFSFLHKVWESDNLIVPEDIFDKLTERLISVLEIKLLNVSSSIVKLTNDEESYKITNDSLDSILNFNFPNLKVLINLIANSSLHFQNVFLILTDIFIKSECDSSIQSLIYHLLEEVKCRSRNESIISLYPHDLQNVVFFLENDPNKLATLSPGLYHHTLEKLNCLLEEQQFNFVFLMSHYNLWFEHCTKNMTVDK